MLFLFLRKSKKVVCRETHEVSGSGLPLCTLNTFHRGKGSHLWRMRCYSHQRRCDFHQMWQWPFHRLTLRAAHTVRYQVCLDQKDRWAKLVCLCVEAVNRGHGSLNDFTTLTPTPLGLKTNCLKLYIPFLTISFFLSWEFFDKLQLCEKVRKSFICIKYSLHLLQWLLNIQKTYITYMGSFPFKCLVGLMLFSV